MLLQWFIALPLSTYIHTLTRSHANPLLCPCPVPCASGLRLDCVPSGNVNVQVAEVCRQLEGMQELRGGFNMVGFSQGGQFLRVSGGSEGAQPHTQDVYHNECWGVLSPGVFR